MAYFEGLNGVNRQKSNGQKFNRELSKKLTFYHQRSKKQINTNCQKVSTVGTSNLTISADPNRTPSSWKIFKLEKQVEPMFSKTPSLDITITYNLLISKNVSEFLQVKRHDSPNNKTVSNNLYRNWHLLKLLGLGTFPLNNH